MGWKDVIKTVAPTLATALGTPLAGAATKVIVEGLLGKDKASESDLDALLMAPNPEVLAKLKEIDNQFKIRMEELDVDVFRLEVEDRNGARQAHKDNTFPTWLTLILTVLVGGLSYTLFYQAIPSANEATLYMVFGQIVTAWIGSTAYWFGTTKSSSEKNKALIESVRK